MVNPLKIKIDKRSKYLRSLVVRSLIGGGRGHMGSAMSLIEMLRVLYDDIAKFKSSEPKKKDRDRIILSKGHGCLALYVILADLGFFDKSYLKKFCHPDSILGGHPEYKKINGVEASTGALGHGLPIGIGMAISAKINKINNKILVLLGDGEQNEGSIWESALSASKHQLDNLVVLIDYNKIQSYGFVKDVLNLEPLSSKWESFGFNVHEVNGHDKKQIKDALNSTKNLNQKPNAIICHTIKGKGFKFAENNPFWHHKNSFSKKEIVLINESLK